MARRRKTSPFEDLTDLVSLLPWWAGVALALVLYVVLHRVAAQQVIASAGPGQVGSLVTQTVWRSFATVGQYLLPLICLVGAGLSAWRRRERQALVGTAAESKAADALDGMSWQQFEKLVGEAFCLQGYAVTEIGGGGADGGVDLLLRKGSEKFFVQCKQWRAFKVGVDVVRELYGVMAAKGATGGFVVTSGRFTEEATHFANGRNVTLIDGPALHGLIRQAQHANFQQSGAGATAAPMREPAATASSTAPKCPNCTKPMVKRTARRGANAGGEFWGCTGYPACKGVRPFASLE